MSHEPIALADAPEIPGLSFRHFRGNNDYPPMVAAIRSSAEVDRLEHTVTVEEMARNYDRLTNCDPFKDMILAEIAGEVIGYSRGWWWDETATGRIYELVGFLVPGWRRKGIGRAMLLWMENHLRDVASTHPRDQARFFQASASQFQEGTAIMLERAGYRPARYFFQMVRPSLDDIPEAPLPDGLEVRPALPEHYRPIWASVDETSQDEWGYTEPTEEDYQAWLTSPRFHPHLWQVAWDTAAQQVAGHVLTFIDHAQNEEFNRKRGYTEGIGAGKAWRRRGLARALIIRSLQAQRAEGMSESAMAVDSDNPGATRLYEGCGFRVVRRDAIYRKPF